MPEQETLLPAEENERLERAAELLRLRAEVQELSVARYVRGPEGCTNGDRDCDEYVTEGGDDNDVAWCSHVEHGIATLADVVRADRLEELVNDVKALAGRWMPDELAASVLETISDGMAALKYAVAEIERR